MGNTGTLTSEFDARAVFYRENQGGSNPLTPDPRWGGGGRPEGLKNIYFFGAWGRPADPRRGGGAPKVAENEAVAISKMVNLLIGLTLRGCR